MTTRPRPFSQVSVTAAVAVIAGLLAAVALWGPGIVNTRGGGDSPFLLQRTSAMAENLSYGIFPPRWMSHAAYDLGYPFFNYYAALPYYLSGGLTALGVDILTAIQATQTAGFILAALAMAMLARRLFASRAAQLLAVVAYTFAPFHLVNVYVRGDSLSEFYAFIWYPLILWSLDRIAERPTRGRTVTAALAYGGLILTHNVSALIFSPFALLWGIAALVHRAKARGRAEGIPKPAGYRTVLRGILPIVAPFVLGFLLTAWFWLPAVGETDYGQMGAEFTAGYFHYSNHFRGANLIQPSPLFAYSVATDLGSTSPFAMGLAQAALTAAGVGLMVVSTVRRRHSAGPTMSDFVAVVTVVGLVVATLMITPLSRPLWDHLPLLEITQFPWRFLSVQALFSALATGALGEASVWGKLGLTSRRRLVRVGLATAAGLSVIVSTLGGLRPERLRIDPDDVTLDNLLLYESFTGNIGTTIRYEYLPRDVVPRLYTSEAVIDGAGSPVAAEGSQLEASLITRRPDQQTWQVRLPDGPATVAFPLNWWPGWRATVDGEPTASGPLPGSGRIALSLPAGEHTVAFILGSTPLRLAAGWISVLATLAIGSWIVAAGSSAGWRPARSGVTTVATWAAVITGVSLVGPWLGQLDQTAQPTAIAPTATFFDFEQMPFPHEGPVDYGSAELRTAAQSRTVARPGDRLAITLSWAQVPTAPLTATLALVSPAEPRHGVSYTLAEVTVPVAKLTEAVLDLPPDLTRGLYLLELSVSDAGGDLTPRTAQGRTMGDLYIGAVRIPEGPPLPADAPVIGVYRDLTLHGVEVRQQDPTDLAVEMQWSTQGTPRNWRLSLRLLDTTGRLIAQQDHQPGYGYLPTTQWRPGELVVDTAHLPIPEGQAPGDYILRIILYLQATGEGGGEQDFPVSLTDPTRYDIREACCEQTRKGATILCQTRDIALLNLSGPETITEGDDLVMQAEWNALLKPTADLNTRWQVTRPDGTVIAELEQPTAPGSATSAWPRFTWVLAPVAFDLPNQLPAGSYDIDLTFVGAEGEMLTCGTVADLVVTARPRVFEPPAFPKAQNADFAGTIDLLGYQVVPDREADVLALTIWWQAETSSAHDLKRFVHLYDPATETIVAQDDAMPRDWAYPTSWWVSGEIVSETITLNTAGIPDGTYRLGVGWYDPATVTRLQATLADGTPAPDGRVTLAEPVILPAPMKVRFRWPWAEP